MRQLPDGYSLHTENKHSFYTVRPDGERTSNGSYLEELYAVRDAWNDYHEQLAKSRNAEREDEETHILAWCNKATGNVYSVNALSHFVPLQFLEEITVATHGKGIARMACACCGVSAVDDDVLEKFGLLEWEGEEEDG